MQSYCLEPRQDMANQEERIKGLETITGDARERIARIEGKLEAAPKAMHPVLVTLISVVCVAVVTYLGWTGTQIVDYGKRLTAIDIKLTVLGLQSQASLPQSAFNKTLSEVRSTISTARRDKISVPPKVIEDLNAKLLRAGSDSPDFWPTLSEFINYRSLVASVPPEKVNNLLSAKIPNCTDSLPKPMKVLSTNTPSNGGSTSTLSKGSYDDCRFVLDSEEQDQKLNAILKGNTPVLVFHNCLIEYHGGDINLILAWDKEPLTMTLHPGVADGREPQVMQMRMTGPAIGFANCLFNFTFKNAPSSNGQLLSTALLGQDAASASLPTAM